MDRFWNDVCVPGGNGSDDDGGVAKAGADPALFPAAVKSASLLEMFGSLYYNGNRKDGAANCAQRKKERS